MLNKRDKELRIVMSNYDDKRNPWYAGGGAIVVHEVARRLAKTYSVEVITGSYPGSKKREVIDGVCYQRVGFSFFGPWIGQLSYWILLPFYSVFRTFDVWIESFVPPFGVSILPWITSKPVIGLIHMLPGMDMWRKYRLPFFLFERMGLRWYDRFIVLSDSMGKAIQKYNKRAKIHVIPNGVDMPNLGKKREKEHLLFIGRIEMDQKGLDLLLDAYSNICSEIGYPLVIAGSGIANEVEHLRNQVCKLSCSEKIKLVGRVEGIEKDTLFNGAVSVMIPSRFETFSVVALEALSYGVPAVGFNIPGLSTFSSEHVFKATPFSVESLAQEILNSISSRKSTEYYQSEARKYHWDSIVSLYDEVIKECI